MLRLEVLRVFMFSVRVCVRVGVKGGVRVLVGVVRSCSLVLEGQWACVCACLRMT